MQKISSGLTVIFLFGLSLILRLSEEILTIDGVTGFIIPEYKTIGIILGVFSVAACAAGVLVIDKFTKFSVNGMKPDILIIFSSLILGVLSVIDGFKTESVSGTFSSWMIFLMAVVGLVNGVFFFCYAMSSLFKVKIPKGLFVAPLICSIIRLIRFFALTTSITIITDNVFSLFYYCATVLFMLQFANIANAVGGKKSLKKMRTYGYTAFMASMLNSVPRIIKIFADSNSLIHESIISTLLSLVTGIFAFVLTFDLFDKKKKSGNNNHIVQA